MDLNNYIQQNKFNAEVYQLLLERIAFCDRSQSLIISILEAGEQLYKYILTIEHPEFSYNEILEKGTSFLNEQKTKNFSNEGFKPKSSRSLTYEDLVVCLAISYLRFHKKENLTVGQKSFIHDLSAYPCPPPYVFQDLEYNLIRFSQIVDKLLYAREEPKQQEKDHENSVYDQKDCNNHKKKFEPTDHTFSKCNGTVNGNITLLYQTLIKVWIDSDTKPDVFLKLFSGGLHHLKIKLKKNVGADNIYNLIKKMLEDGFISTNGEPYTNIVRSHFDDFSDRRVPSFKSSKTSKFDSIYEICKENLETRFG